MGQSIENIKTWSQSLYYASYVLYIGVIVSLIITIAVQYLNAWRADEMSLPTLLIPLIWLVPVPALFSGLSHLRQLLLGFQSGEIFTEANAEHIKIIGREVWWGMAAYLIVAPLILSWVSQYRFQFRYELSDLLVILLGSILFLLGWVMAQAIKIKTENDNII